jgi:hypothetical protein
MKGTGYPLHSPVSPPVRRHVPSHVSWTLLINILAVLICNYLNMFLSLYFCMVALKTCLDLASVVTGILPEYSLHRDLFT